MNYKHYIFYATIIGGFLGYTLSGLPDHFFKHFFFAFNIGLLFLIFYTFFKKKIYKNHLKFLWFLWIIAIFPDILHILGYNEHPGRWINVFLLHNILDKYDNIEWYLGAVLLIEILMYLQLNKKYKT